MDETEQESTQTDPSCVFDYALLILNTPCSREKARLTIECYESYHSGKLPMGNPQYSQQPPIECARPDYVRTKSRFKMKSRKSKAALVHSLAHIESYAIDLSWDVCLRFARQRAVAQMDHVVNSIESGNFKDFLGNRNVYIPNEFFEDWMKVAWDEARHFTMWDNRLSELNSTYGAYEAHAGLWDACKSTQHDILARLAIVHMVMEGHGLDVAPALQKKMKKLEDEESLRLSHIIERDEVTHVGAGKKWFEIFACDLGLNPKDEFQKLVKENYQGHLKGPFNYEMRDLSGFPRDWYEPLANNLKKG